MKLYEHWIAEYRNNRYMSHLDNDRLNERMRYLIENLTTLEPCGKIGMGNISLNPWKELIIKFTHVQAEMDIRGESPKKNFLSGCSVPKPMLDNSVRLREISKLASLKKPHLIKFGKKEYLKDYSLKISLASSFSDPSLNAAQMDDEMKAIFHLSAEKATITTMDGSDIQPIGTIDLTLEIDRDYYVFCSSGIFDIRMFSNFEADSCLFIYDSQRFADDLVTGVASQVEIEEHAYRMVDYVDPIQYKSSKLEPVIEFYKHIKYQYQREYRHVIIPKNKPLMPKDIFLNLNSAKNYSELICL